MSIKTTYPEADAQDKTGDELACELILELKIKLKSASDDRDRYHALLNASIEATEELQKENDEVHEKLNKAEDISANMREELNRIRLGNGKIAYKALNIIEALVIK